MENTEIIMTLRDVHYKVITPAINLSILKNINATILKGSTVAITGVSGSGKTTLLNLMAGLDLPTTGTVHYRKQNMTDLDEDQRAKLRANHISFVFQSFQLLPSLTALENIMLPLEITKQSAVMNCAKIWLEQVGLIDRAKHYPHQLSGGEQQRIAIARAFAMEPDLLFADEPTGNLDLRTGQRIIDLLLSLNQHHQTTLVVVTHDTALADRCHYHWPLVDGTLQC